MHSRIALRLLRRSSSFIFIFAVSAILLLSCRNDRDQPTEQLLHVPDDLQTTLWAESPMINNPTSMDVDYRGRVWVTEGVNYRKSSNKPDQYLHRDSGDRIVILEDTDQDGKADSAKVFVSDKDLVSPLGIAVIGNKVYVSCSPNLLVYTDEDGDDVADKKEIFLTGFGGKDHDHSLHAVIGGPDGLLYFNTGNAGPHEVTDKNGWTLRSGSVYTGGSPYNLENSGNRKSDDGKVWVGGLALRIGSDGKGLKVLGHNFRNAYGLTMDSYGNFFQNDNDDEVQACRTSWLMEGGNAGYFSKDGTRRWDGDQRPWQEVFTAHWHQEDPGVMPAGDRSGAGAPTGIEFNEGDALGEKYRGMLLSADAGRNVIFGYRPTPHQSGYDMGERKHLISSLASDNPNYEWNDSLENTKKEKWFRPSDVAIGTDGAMYISDWFDGVVGGHRMADTTGFGRIYRITPKSKTLTAPQISFKTTEDLIKAFLSPAVNVRHHAFVVMAEKGEEMIAPVKKLLTNDNPYVQARAVWLLAALGERGIEETKQLLKHPDHMIRVTALRALRQKLPDFLPIAQQLASDTSAFVRRELVIALGELPFEKAKPLLVSLAAADDATDGWFQAALSTAVSGHEDEMYHALKEQLAKDIDPLQWSDKMARIAFTLHPHSAVDDLAKRAMSTALDIKSRSSAMTALSFISTRDAVEKMMSISSLKDEEAASRAAYWLAYRSGNDWFNLVDKTKSKINLAEQRKLNEMNILAAKIRDPRMPYALKKHTTYRMAVDSVGGTLLLNMIEAGEFPDTLNSTAERAIFRNPLQEVRIRATNYFQTKGENFSIPSVLALSANANSGGKIFTQSCANCHRVKNEGKKIGPELTGINKKFDKEKLLDAIIHPDAGILLGYEPWLVTKKDGGSAFGFIVADGDDAVVIKDLTGNQQAIAKTDIAARKQMEKSLMPEPSALNLTAQDLADVSEYLMNIK